MQLFRCCLLLAAVSATVPAAAVPFTPRSDTDVLATVPARGTGGSAALSALRAAWRADPQDAAAAAALARRYFDEVAADGDPRYIGFAQQTLAPWWQQPAPPPAVRVLRAKLLQFDHRFAPALADLNAALQAEPDNADAWAWRSAIHMVQADYAEARRGCAALARLASALIAAACSAQVDAATGQAARASAALQAALRQPAPAAERLWSLTVLAETEERRGEFAAAEAAFTDGLAAARAVGRRDVYLLAAYSDFLLDRNRPADVLKLLQGTPPADVLLLRRAIAEKALGSAAAAATAAELAARFEAARSRGDTSHRKEEARFLLAVRSDARAALLLAEQNFAQQREPADARLLLEAALAAGAPAAALPALAWLQQSRIDSVALNRLAAQLKGAR